MACRRTDDAAAAAAGLAAGGVWAFPTETFYGLGCRIMDAAAVQRVYQLKHRPVQRPLPVLAGSVGQLAAVVRLDEAPALLRERFWPGSLTILLPVLPQCRAALPPQVCGPDGKMAVRLTPHPAAARLACLAGMPLTCSSANLSGQPAARTADELAPALLQHLDAAHDGILVCGPLPQGGLPSTIVEPLGQRRLRLLRSGAVAPQQLAAAGFTLEDAPDRP